MCFVPKVSLATALVEFFTAAWMYYRFPKNTLTFFFSIIVFILGIYQMTEFLLCTIGQVQIWGRVGFIAYSFIPAVTLFYSITLAIRKPNFWLVFSPALFFVFFSIIDQNFILEGTCSTMFVTVRNKFSYSGVKLFPFPVYAWYYYSYLALSVVSLFIGMIKTKERKRVGLFLLMILSIIFTLVPPLILIIIIPSLGIKFPSIYCHFAMILTLITVAGLYIENRPSK